MKPPRTFRPTGNLEPKEKPALVDTGWREVWKSVWDKTDAELFAEDPLIEERERKRKQTLAREDPNYWLVRHGATANPQAKSRTTQSPEQVEQGQQAMRSLLARVRPDRSVS